jgi:hypothetical protein
VTVAGILTPERHAVIVLNTKARSVNADDIEQRAETESGHPVELRIVEDEGVLLDELGYVVFDYIEKEYDCLVTFNGDNWSGGFDIPYLRTKCGHYDVDWPFEGVTHNDLYPIVQRRFHTVSTNGGEEPVETNDLVRAHRLLCLPEHEFDPYEDSVEAVNSHYNGEFGKLVLHNVSDLHRTLDLGNHARRYASPKDLQGDKL